MVEKQNIGSNSSQNIQINGDLVIHELNYDTLKNIFMDLFDANFPKLQSEAHDKALKNVYEMITILNEKINLYKEKIDFLLLKAPDVQYTLESSIISSAKKGKKISIETLCNLIIERLSTNDEIYELIIEESISILPKLTKKHIKLLNLISLSKELKSINDLKKIEELEAFYKNIIETCNIEIDITLHDIQYINSLGLIDILSNNGIRSVKSIDNQNTFFEFLINFNPYLTGKKDIEIQEIIKTNPSIIKINELYEKYNLRNINLMPIGRLISISELKNSLMPDIDCKAFLF